MAWVAHCLFAHEASTVCRYQCTCHRKCMLRNPRTDMWTFVLAVLTSTPPCACICCQSTVKHQLSAEEAKAQAAELVRKARIKREREEAELARTREREVRACAATPMRLQVV
jgi:hypothetical protein